MPAPVFGFLAFTSGSYEGAIVRDMRLANALHRRGFPVRIYWLMEKNPELVDRGIPQRWLATGLRYYTERPGSLLDRMGKLTVIWPAKRRRRFLQERPELVERLLSNFCRAICDGDPALSARVASACRADGVTHLLPTFAMTCPFVRDLKRDAGAEYLVTFQGEEIFANYAARIGRLDDYNRRLREAVDGSAFPAVAVSRDYVDRVSTEIGVDRAKLRPIYPGIELPESNAATPSFDELKSIHADLRPDVPIIAYLGRQDPEKGIDLLLYAVRMVRDRTGRDVQVVVAGGTSFGQHYQDSCKAIAEHLRLPVYWKRRITDAARNALFAHARMVVYPPIHREPFGMVAAEVMSHGTPVIVPDLGGITEVITSADGRAGGLTFRTWDSADLSVQIERLLVDDVLHARLKSDARSIAEQFSVDRMTDEVLRHMGLSPAPATN
jgi:glycosyltransferase involved in cell wall biosynthesis